MIYIYTSFHIVYCTTAEVNLTYSSYLGGFTHTEQTFRNFSRAAVK